MSGSKAVQLQSQVRQNAEELQDFIKDLANWEKEMRITDEEIKRKGNVNAQDLPPIRAPVGLQQKKLKNKKKMVTELKSSKEEVKQEECKRKRIAGYDYRAWDKFNVNEALKEIDENKKEKDCSEDSSEDSENELIELGKRKQQALLEKDKGNAYFKKGNYDMAISCYSNGLLMDPSNPLLLANRAMALLKKGQLAAAESDCDTCLKLEPTYVKAYHRRGTARVGLKKYHEAKADFVQVLQFDPGNKETKLELENIEKVLNSTKINNSTTARTKIVSDAQNWEHSASQNVNDPSIVMPIYKPPHLRSQKPMKKISIKNVTNILQDSESSVIQEIPLSSMHSGKKESISYFCGNGEEINSMKATEQKSEPHTSEIPNSPLFEGIKPMPVVSLPPVPSTSYQFLTDWKKMRHHPDMQYEYLKEFPPERLPTIFKQSIDTDLFTGILHILSSKFLENKDDVFSFLKYLSLVGRFQTIVMFLSEQEISDLKNLFDYTRKMQKCSEDEICNLWNSYCLK